MQGASSSLISSLKKLSWALQTFFHDGNNSQSMYTPPNTHTHTHTHTYTLRRGGNGGFSSQRVQLTSPKVDDQ